MSTVSAAEAVWHVVSHTVPAAVAMGSYERPSGLRVEHLTLAAELGSVVQSMLREAPSSLLAVVLDAYPSALLRLVPHLPAITKTPVVFHIATRDEHADVLGLRQSGVSMLYSTGAAEAEAHALVAHRIASDTHTAVVHFYDAGAPHAVADGELYRTILPQEITSAPVTEAVIDTAFQAVGELLHRSVAPYAAHGPEDAAETVIVLGSGGAALAEGNLRVVSLHLVRPLLPARLVGLVRQGVERVAVLEATTKRTTRLPPIFVDVASAFQHVDGRRPPAVLRSGVLGTVESAADAQAVHDSLASQSAQPFVVGKPHDPPAPKRALVPATKHEQSYQVLLEQLFKERLFVVNSPEDVKHPAATSPEFAFGRTLAQLERTDELVQAAERAIAAKSTPGALVDALRAWLPVRGDSNRARGAAEAVRVALKGAQGAEADAVRALENYLMPTSRWIIGHDAWAYDSGFGGVHHVISAQRNVNMLVFDTVPYTTRNDVPLHQRKKDIGLYAMNYGTVYVASTAVYSDYTQVLHALLEADRFDGPSIVLAYVPYAQVDAPALDVLRETKLAVDSGYWPLYRWDPSAAQRNMSVFQLDSVRVRQQLQEFLERDNHMSLLANEQPELPYDLAVSQGTALRERQKRLAKAAYENMLGGLEGPSLLVLYASDAGGAEKVARRLALRGKLRGLGVRVLAMDDFPFDELAGESNVVFVTSTAGQGEPPQNGRLTFKALNRAPMGTLSEETRFAVFGMGDSHYWPRPEDAHFYNKPGKDLDRRLAEIGGQRLVELGLGDDQDADGWATGYKAWEPTLWKALGVDNVAIVEEEPEPVTNEHIKVASNYLRGTIVEGLADTSTGAIAESDTQLTKFHGTYMQYDRDTVEERKAAGLEPAYGFMIRVRMPGGNCSPQQWLQLDQVTEKFGGIKSLKITTRQTVQFHMILKRNLKAAMQEINKSMFDTIAACGDVNRNVMCSPNLHLTEESEQMHATAKSLSESLLPRMNAYHEIWLDKGTDSSSKLLVGGAVQDYEPLYGPYYLPRKFKVAMALPPRNDVDVFAHDVGLIAIAENSQLVGFNLSVGGGMGVTHSMKATYPRLGDVIGFVTPDQVNEVCREIMLIQRDTGDRKNRKQARLKYTIDKFWGGAANFRTELERRLGYALGEARPFTFTSNTDEYGWKQDRRGNWHCTLWLENGRVIDEPGKPFRTGLRELAKIHRGVFRLTPNQHIIVSEVPPEDKERIDAHLGQYNMRLWDQSGLRLSASACVAFPTCGLAMAESERYIFRLVDKVERIYHASGLTHDEITLRMSGCPNGCSRPWIGEIAFVGKAPGRYLMLLGGDIAGMRLNKIFRDNVGEEEILEILGVLIPRYARERLEGERFGDWVIRAGVIAETTHGTNFYDNVDTEKPLVAAA